MSFLRDGVTFALYGDDLKTYLGIPTADASEDFFLNGWLLAACSAGDTFMKNPFDGSPTPDQYPQEVLFGVYEWVRVVREYFLDGAIDGAGNVKTGDLSQGFGGGGLSVADAARNAAKKYWYRYDCLPVY